MTQRRKSSSKMDRMADKIEQLQLDMAQHKAQDEAMYRQLDEVKSGITETNQLLRDQGEKLGEYNKQLAVHIAGTQELKVQSAQQAEALKKLAEATDTRLQKLETPHKWASFTFNILKFIGVSGTAVAALYGLIRFLESHRPF